MITMTNQISKLDISFGCFGQQLFNLIEIDFSLDFGKIKYGEHTEKNQTKALQYEDRVNEYNRGIEAKLGPFIHILK